MGFRVAFSFLVLLSSASQAQVLTGKIIDANTKSSIPFAHLIIAGTHIGTSADIDGKFSLRIKPPVLLLVSSVGYATDTLLIEHGNPIVIALKEVEVQLKEIVITPQENPAHAIMRKVRLNKSTNDPHALATYTFNSYNKLHITLNGNSKLYDMDSSLRPRMDSSELFLSESVVKHSFEKPNRVHEHIEGHKTSGVKSPFFASILTNIQPISFYDDWFFMTVTDKYYLNPLNDADFEKYDFELRETRYMHPDTIFVISFQPQPTKNFESLKGILYINSNGYALENVEAASCNVTDGFGFIIQQKYQNAGGHWFPCQINTDLFIQDKKNSYYGVRYVHKSYFSDIKFNVNFSRTDFPVATRDLAPDVSDKSSTFWSKYRADSLSSRESNTYGYFEKNVNDYSSLLLNLSEIFASGFIRYKKINILLNNLAAFNEYEGWRFGIGFKTNERISKTMQYGAYAGYGLKDNALKFGGNIQVNLNTSNHTYLNFLYQQDVSEPASTITIKQDQNALLKGGLRGLLTSRMDSVQRFESTLASFLTPNLNVEMTLSHESRRPAYSYRYLDENHPQNKYNTSEIAGYLRHAVGEKRTNLGAGIFTATKPPTFFEIKIAKGFKLTDTEFNYLKIQFSATHRLHSKLFGITSLCAGGGYIHGDLPYPYLFNGQGTNQAIAFFYLQNTFQSMPIYEFATDRYASFFISQNFGNPFFKNKKRNSTPEFILTHGAYWGQLSNPEKHDLIALKAPSNGYYEGGAIVNKLLRIRYILNICFIDVGIGAFYRYGYYAYPNHRDNLFLKLMLGASL